MQAIFQYFVRALNANPWNPRLEQRIKAHLTLTRAFYGDILKAEFLCQIMMEPNSTNIYSLTCLLD